MVPFDCEKVAAAIMNAMANIKQLSHWKLAYSESHSKRLWSTSKNDDLWLSKRNRITSFSSSREGSLSVIQEQLSFTV